jgi:hypothetical protein
MFETLKKYLQTLKKDEIFILYLINILSFSGLFYFTFYQNNVDKINMLRMESSLMQLNTEDDQEIIDKKNNTQIQLDQEKEKYQNLEQDFSTLEYLFVGKNEYRSFINSLNLFAEKNNIQIQNINYKNNKNTTSFSSLYDINISLQSDYKNTLLFISKVEQNRLFIIVNNITIIEKNTNISFSIWGLK